MSVRFHRHHAQQSASCSAQPHPRRQQKQAASALTVGGSGSWQGGGRPRLHTSHTPHPLPARGRQEPGARLGSTHSSSCQVPFCHASSNPDFAQPMHPPKRPGVQHRTTLWHHLTQPSRPAAGVPHSSPAGSRAPTMYQCCAINCHDPTMQQEKVSRGATRLQDLPLQCALQRLVLALVCNARELGALQTY